MMTAYIILLLAIALWKLYFVWRRGIRAYTRSMNDYSAFYEYQLGNGVPHDKARRPFVLYAFKKAFRPLLLQWRLFLLLAVLGIIVYLLS